MLKHFSKDWYQLKEIAATFGWLCVETDFDNSGFSACAKAATFGWLCVETLEIQKEAGEYAGSHLRVAVC